MKEEVDSFEQRLKKRKISLIKTNQGILESKIFSGAPLQPKEIFDHTQYAATFVLEFIKLCFSIGGFLSLTSQLIKFIKGIKLKSNKDVLLMSEIEREKNFPLNIYFAINNKIADNKILDALKKIPLTISLFKNNLSRYKDSEILVVSYNENQKCWDLENLKGYKHNRGLSCWRANRTIKGHGLASKKDVPDKQYQNLWEMLNDPISEKAKTNALKFKASYYQRLYTIQDIKMALSVCPVTISVDIFKSFMNAKNGIVTLPNINEKRISGHSVLICGFNDDKKVFIINNGSWGRKWGNNGLGCLPFSYIEKYLIEAWGMQLLLANLIKLSIKNFFKLKFLKSCFADRKNKGILENGFIKDKRNLTIKYEVKNVQPIAFSRGSFFIINIFDNKVKEKYGGWSHFSYDSQKRIIEIEELLISEENRGYGWGSEAIKIVEEYAKKWQVEKIIGWVSIEDAYNEIQKNLIEKFFKQNNYSCIDDNLKFRGCLFRFEKYLLIQ
ncbi:MAG: C1 family peptidase [Patescibacteria group bacterium]